MIAGVAEALAEARSPGLGALDEEPRPVAHKTRIACVDGRLPDGVLVELIEIDVVAGHRISSAA